MSEAVSYLRVSGLAQINGDGFPRQREAIDAYARLKSLEVVEEYAEEGVCGENELDERPSLSRLFERLATNGIRLVIVERADRLARMLMVQELLLDQFRKLGVTVVTSEGVDLTVTDEDPTRILIRQVLGAVAQFQKSELVLKLKAARKRMRSKEGKCEGPKHYGHHPLRPEEKPVLDLMLKLHDAGATLREITQQLTQQGHKPRKSATWKRGTVYRIVKQELQRRRHAEST